MSAAPIRVLIVDDSAIVRKLLSESLKNTRDIEVVGTAPDPIVAAERVRLLQPDVLTLDIEMPRMDGVSFLRTIQPESSPAVIVVGSLGQAGCSAALEALKAGAVEVVPKPDGPFSVSDLRDVLPQKIRAAHHARRRKRLETAPVRRSSPVQTKQSSFGPKLPLVALGASTGGTEALRAVLESLPETMPPMLIVQHIPPVFSRAFADRLNQSCKLRVAEAVDGQAVEPGLVLIAPGDQHMILERKGGVLKVSVKSGPRVCYQRPSVDVLFHSVANTLGARAIGVILTGMGSDGARGMLQMKEAGARTIAQDEATCVVYGMPREAARLGAAQQILPLGMIAGALHNASGCQS